MNGPCHHRAACLAAALTLLSSSLVYAQQPPPEAETTERKEDGTEVQLSLYFFIPARIGGRAGVGGFEVDVNTTFADVFNAADVGALAARAEVWRGPFGGVIDASYSRIDVEEVGVRQGPMGGQFSGEVDLEYRLGIVDLLAGARPLDLDLSKLVGLQLDLLMGARIVDFKEELQLIAGSTRVELGDSHNWVELAFGARATLRVGPAFLAVRGDVSGFGIGSASDYIANLLLSLGFRPVDQFSVELGYRVLDMYYDRGSGNDELSFDVTQHGPQLTFSLYF